MPEIHKPMQKVAKQSTTGGLVLPMYPHPFYGTCENPIGMGVKPKKKAKGCYWEKTVHSTTYEVMKYLLTSGKKIFYSGDEIQERDSVLCGYWDLYYLLERQKGVPMLNVIHNAKFDMNDQFVNHRFIIDYFKNI